MPNWNNNTIVIEGPAVKIQALWAAASTDSGLLQAMLPMPTELEDTTADGSAGPNWYNWRVENWGTKWDLNMEGLELVELEDGRAQITGYADSAWSPPVPAFQAYANANSDVYLELKYFEPGMSFIGVWDSEGGDAYWEDIGQLIKDNAEMDDAVIAELFEHFDVWSWYDVDEEETEISTAEQD